MEKFYRQYDNCRQNERPFCSVACPFNVDVLDFQYRMANGSYNAAYKTYRNAVAFPDIIAALCPEYCSSVCPRKDLDQSVQLNLLERTCVAKATKKEPTDYNVPKKEGKIAIIGAGLSGLSCALRLAQKRYDVTIYEKSERLGGSLWDILPYELFLGDFERQFQFEEYDVLFNKEIKGIDDLSGEGYDAVFVATGKNGIDFGLTAPGVAYCMMDGDIALFAGGSLVNDDKVKAAANGLCMAWSIEVFLKTGSLEYPKKAGECKAVADPDKLVKAEAVIPANNGLFSDEEARAEASRCIRCQCDACMNYCDICTFYKKWPMKIRDDVIATVAFSMTKSMIRKTPAKRLVNSCTDCGLCDEVCPESIEIGNMLIEARRHLHSDGAMPGAFHQFWIRDMEFSDSEFAALTRGAPEKDKCSHVFFPGCQLGASDPAYVYKSYRWLLDKNPGTGLMLRCCGLPAKWAGDEKMHNQAAEKILSDWNKLGKPVLIMACASCMKHFEQYLPEIDTVSLYEMIKKWGYEDILIDKDVHKGKSYSVFDPCSARHKIQMQTAVRDLLLFMGIDHEELPKGDVHGCCGYGGQGSVANPDFFKHVVQSRSVLSDNPYIVYCINCKDVFKQEGKSALHILDLIFGIDKGDNSLPGLTGRRHNRVDLKEKILKDMFDESMKVKPGEPGYKLEISDEMHKKMNKLKILEEDVCKVIELGETKNRRVYNQNEGTYICYRVLGDITFWVEYRLKDGKHEIVDVYTHRMKIKLEAVWDGRKTTDIDM